MARELTREEKRAIRALVTKWCANYDRECGCLPLFGPDAVNIKEVLFWKKIKAM